MKLKNIYSYLEKKLLLIYMKFDKIIRLKNLNKEILSLRNNKVEIIQHSSLGYKLKASELGISKELLSSEDEEYFIGEIDQDGFLLSELGEIKGIPSIKASEFMEREKYRISLVVKNDILAIKKEYRDRKYEFVNELKALNKLNEIECRVPAILDIDFKNLNITYSYIHGSVIREELAQAGARLRDSQTGRFSDYSYQKRKEIEKKQLSEGRKYLKSIVDKRYIKIIENEVNKIHSNGLIINDVKYGNIIKEFRTGEPYLIDFEVTRLYKNTNSIFYKLLKKYDENKFDQLFR